MKNILRNAMPGVLMALLALLIATPFAIAIKMGHGPTLQTTTENGTPATVHVLSKSITRSTHGGIGFYEIRQVDGKLVGTEWIPTRFGKVHTGLRQATDAEQRLWRQHFG